MKSVEDIQFLGFFGIFKEALSVTTSYKKISCLLILSIAMRLLFFFLLIQIELISRSSLVQYYKYAQMESLMYFDTGSEMLPFFLLVERISFWLYKIAYFTLYQTLSLSHTSAVVYATACSYTAKEITYKKVTEEVPAKLRKRLMVNYIWNIIIVLALHIIAICVVNLCAFTLGQSPVGITVIIILLLTYLSGFVYINILWQLTNVVSVLENIQGVQALLKSKKLIKGNTGVAYAIFITICILCIPGMQLGFEAMSIGDAYSVWEYISCVCHACLWFMLVSLLILFGLVTQTIIYFICKSYHHENVDKLLLRDHLHELSRGDYIQSLKSKIVQFVFLCGYIVYMMMVDYQYYY